MNYSVSIILPRKYSTALLVIIYGALLNLYVSETYNFTI